MPLTPARIEIDAEGVPQASLFGDRYHPREGAAAQAREVFLAGNGLPAGWAGRTDFTLLETGFGLGNNFLATWQAWRDDPARPRTLHYVSIEAHPPRRDDLQHWHAASPWPELAAALIEAWPPAVDGLHPIDFDDSRVRLLLAFGDAGRIVRELDLAADAVFLDGFAPDRNPAMWAPELMQGLARCLAPGATAATWTVARSVRDALAAAGFEVDRVDGHGAKRQTLRARWIPRSQRGPPPRGGSTAVDPAATGPQSAPATPMTAAASAASPTAAAAASHRLPGAAREAIVVGAGLAGASAAFALARQGWTVCVLDRRTEPAAESSGNPGGLFHATVHADEGAHLRLHRAGALLLARRLAPWIAAGRVPGHAGGMLQMAADDEDLASMRALIARHATPSEIVEAVDAAQASRRAGVALHRPAWFYPQGGWARPPALVRALLDVPGVSFAGGVEVASMRRCGAQWELLDAAGTVVDRAPVVVLANADGAARLWPQAGWPIGRGRGQLSIWAAGPDTPRLGCPLSGAGYAITLPDGSLLAGATATPEDTDPALRDADHDFNRGRLRRLTGWDASAPSAGRVGWRVQAPDRLPIVGAVPTPGAVSARPTQARWQPREPGLFVLTALGSRGLVLGPLMGEVLAAWVSGAPMPIEAKLRDAIDPARWIVRAARKSPPV
jgi:tRNA 5-methylaminomethyl-2-thiouridine biosynthesis bifunctional protein